MSRESEFLTVDEYAGLMRVTPETVRRLIRSNTIPAVKVGRQYRLQRPLPLESAFDQRLGVRSHPCIHDFHCTPGEEHACDFYESAATELPSLTG